MTDQHPHDARLPQQAEILEEIAKQPRLRYTEDRDCPPCQASREMEERHATLPASGG